MQHSKYGGSGFSILIHCPGSRRMCEGYPNLSTPASELGTAAHELAEFAMKMGVDSYKCKGLTFNNHIATDEMCEDVSVYINHLRAKKVNNPGSKMMLESRVVMSSVGDDVYGTGDAITLIPQMRKMDIDDLKYGFVMVNVDETPQLPFYGVAALDTYNLWDQVDTIECTIIQPRGEHIDGDIRIKTYTIAEMHQWRETFRATIALARTDNAPLIAGEHCTYCKARDNCRARYERTLTMLGHDAPLHTLGVDELMNLYLEIPTIKRQLDAVGERVLELARTGKVVPGHKLVKAIARHECKDEDGFIKAAIANGVEREKLFNAKLKSKTDLLKIVDKNIVNSNFVAPPTQYTLAPLHDRRPGRGVNAAIGVFDAVPNQVIFDPVE